MREDPGEADCRHVAETRLRETILAIYPNSPAAGTGIEVGDKILAVNGKPVHSMEEIIASTEGMVGPGASITIETQRGSYVVTPKYPSEAEQCYWEIIRGPVESASGTAVQADTRHQRFFRATCRFADKKAYICHPSWQE